MGYTHYWEFKKSPKSVDNGAELFKLAVQATKDCIAQVPADLPTVEWGWNSDKQKYEVIGEGKVPFKLCGGNGWGEPKFNDDVVCFNGDASKDYDHETCYLSMDSKGFNFCKTARKPYDVAVCITLICFKHFFGDLFEYSSDGNIEEGEEGWKLAREITSKYFE